MYKQFAAAFVFLTASGLFAQDVYRCGNEYTNTIPEDQKKTCLQITGKPTTRPVLLDDKKSLYSKCLTDASKAPTEAGLKLAIQVCKERYQISN